jgi:hypothetical protein
MATSRPPPSAAPWITATTGLLQASIRLQTSNAERLDRGLARFADIGTGDERLALAHDDHGLDRGAGIGLLRGAIRPWRTAAPSIDGRIVDADEQDVTVLPEFDDRGAGLACASPESLYGMGFILTTTMFSNNPMNH